MNVFKMMEQAIGIKHKEVGVVSEEVLNKHKSFRKTVDDIQEQAGAEAKALKEKHEAELKALHERYEEQVDLLEPQFDAMWNDVYAELNLTIDESVDGQFSLNIETGQVTEKIVPEEIKAKMKEVKDMVGSGMSYEEIFKKKLREIERKHNPDLN